MGAQTDFFSLVTAPPPNEGVKSTNRACGSPCLCSDAEPLAHGPEPPWHTGLQVAPFPDCSKSLPTFALSPQQGILP